METTLSKNLGEKTQVLNGRTTVLAGILTGQAAGIIMAVVVMLVFTLFLGKGPLYPVQVIGSAVFGESALQGTHFGAVLVGLVLHQLGPSLLWGTAFGLMANQVEISNSKTALGLGLIVGLISMLGPYVLIPFIMKTLHGVDYWNQEVPILWDWAAHMVFGASFALFPMIKSKA